MRNIDSELRQRQARNAFVFNGMYAGAGDERVSRADPLWYTWTMAVVLADLAVVALFLYTDTMFRWLQRRRVPLTPFTVAALVFECAAAVATISWTVRPDPTYFQAIEHACARAASTVLTSMEAVEVQRAGILVRELGRGANLRQAVVEGAR